MDLYKHLQSDSKRVEIYLQQFSFLCLNSSHIFKRKKFPFPLLDFHVFVYWISYYYYIYHYLIS